MNHTIFFPNKNGKLSWCVIQTCASIFMASDIFLINFNGDLPFDMMVTLNFVILTTNIRRSLRRIHILEEIWF